MIVYFTDRNLKVLGTASTELKSYYAITDDKKTETVDGGVVIFEVEIAFKPEARLEIENLCEAGNYLLRSNGEETEFYTIVETTTDTLNNTLLLYCEDAGLDLINATAEAYEADKAYPISYYIEKWAAGSGFQIGLNECENLSRKLKWDGSSTVTERLASIATQFDNAEISYSFDIKGMSVQAMLINIHKKRGSYTGEELRLDRDINRITKKKSITEIATALQVTGSTPSGASSPITLKGYSFDDGDCYVEGTLLKSRNALMKWGRAKALDKNIIRTYSYETESVSELCNRAVSELKKRSEAALTLELDIVQLPEGIKIGDYVNVIDDAGGLYIQSRILKLETSVSRGATTAELGDYVVRDSGMSEQIAAIAEQFAKTAKSGQDAISISIESAEGTIFKNEDISTTLTARVFKGPAEVSDEELESMGEIRWYKRGQFVGRGKTLTVNESEDSATYTAQLEEVGDD